MILSADSYLVIQRLQKLSLIMLLDEKQFLKTKSLNELIALIQVNIKDFYKRAWFFLIEDLWKEKDTILENTEIIVLKQILKQGGLCHRECLYQQIKGCTVYMINEAIDSLHKRELIDYLYLQNDFWKTNTIIIISEQLLVKINGFS